MTTPTPTQTRFPARAVARTVVQNVVALATAVPLIVAAIGDDAPEWLIPILAGAVVVAGVVARIMAIPAVNGWLGRVGLSAAPPAVVDALPGSGPVEDHDPQLSRLDRLDGVGRLRIADEHAARDQVHQILDGHVDDVGTWLTSISPHLGYEAQAPIDLIRSGRVEEVLAEARRIAGVSG